MPAFHCDTKATANGVEYYNWPGPGEEISDLFQITHAAVIPPGASVIHVGGQIGNTDDGAVPDNIEDEITEAFRHIELSLRAAGLSGSTTDVWGCVFRVNYFIANTVNDFKPAFLRVMSKHFGANRPIFTGIEVQRLFRPDIHIELEVQAVRAVEKDIKVESEDS